MIRRWPCDAGGRLSVYQHHLRRRCSELIVQTQFLCLPLWNQELWMDITPLTSEIQRGIGPRGWKLVKFEGSWQWPTNLEKEGHTEERIMWLWKCKAWQKLCRHLSGHLRSHLGKFSAKSTLNVTNYYLFHRSLMYKIFCQVEGFRKYLFQSCEHTISVWYPGEQQWVWIQLSMSSQEKVQFWPLKYLISFFHIWCFNFQNEK